MKQLRNYYPYVKVLFLKWNVKIDKVKKSKKYKVKKKKKKNTINFYISRGMVIVQYNYPNYCTNPNP